MTRSTIPPSFSEVHLGPTRIWVRKGYEAWASVLAGDGSVAAEAMVQGGRAAHPVIALPSGERVVVRRYRRGGAMRHLNPDLYFAGHRALDELVATERALAGGVRAPRVLAGAERRERAGYHAWLATTWIPGVLDGASWLAASDRPERQAALADAGRQIARMHASGVGHPDLNLRNLLVRAGGAARAGSGTEVADGKDGARPEVYLIDFDRARLYPGPTPAGRRIRDLLRLERSARKLDAAITSAEWGSLRAGYGAAWPLRGPLG